MMALGVSVNTMNPIGKFGTTGTARLALRLCPCLSSRGWWLGVRVPDAILWSRTDVIGDCYMHIDFFDYD